MKKRITFDDDQLLEALAKHFKIKKEKIEFYYIRSLFRNGHVIDYND